MLCKSGEMSAKCCTVITWSLASLRFFKQSLFAQIAKRLVRSADLSSCEPYELTNLLWAFAVLCKQRRQLGKDLAAPVLALCAAATDIIGQRSGTWKVQVLMSAMVSISILPWHSSSLEVFFGMVDELAGRTREGEHQASGAIL
ncbi:unnamed protein product [Symbiodinium pilosum]|uniref:Uncharacterized protein n=1 Tax=Symbiodinium pilosum TaxID=2952 RepID=A0A812PH03_SYMPI|nr:unnamed protein product [Symbiodinium pilosum]